MTDYGTTGYASSPPAEETSPSATERARTAAGTAASEAGGVASTAVEQTKAVASTAADQTRAVADEAKQHVRRLGQETKSQLRGQVDEQTTRVARSLEDIGQQLTTMSEKSDDPDGVVSAYTRQAGQTVQQWASRIDDGGLDQVFDDVKRFARNRPGVFLLAALGAGFVVGRVVKAVDLGEVVKGDTGNGDSPQDALDTGSDWDAAVSEPAYPTSDPYATLSSGTHTPYETAGSGTEDYLSETGQPAPAAYPASPPVAPVAPAEGAWGQS